MGQIFGKSTTLHPVRESENIKTRKIFSMWVWNIHPMTSAMHFSKVNALFRNLFVESSSFDLLFKQLVTTIVRNESID